MRVELLIAFCLYCRLPFGRYHCGNPDVKRVAAALGRTPSSVAMRLSNFASLDPVHRTRGVKGLVGTGPALEQFWREVHSDWNRAALESEAAWHGLNLPGAAPPEPPQSRSETWAQTRFRLVQGFFRRTVLASYGRACALCGIRPDQLLTARHIIPWSRNEGRRADPTNGLCLCALHDRAFDCGLLAVDTGMRVMVSGKLKAEPTSPIHKAALLAIEGNPITRPTRYHPDPAALEWHRGRVFVG